MRAILVGLGTNGWRLRQPLFPRIAHGVGEGFSNPAAELLKLLTHCSCLTFSFQSQANVRSCQRVEIPVSRGFPGSELSDGDGAAGPCACTSRWAFRGDADA